MGAVGHMSGTLGESGRLKQMNAGGNLRQRSLIHVAASEAFSEDQFAAAMILKPRSSVVHRQ